MKHEGVRLVMATGQANAEILRDKCPTLNVQEQGVTGDVFLERAGCGGKGILCSEEKTFTLSTVDNEDMYGIRQEFIWHRHWLWARQPCLGRLCFHRAMGRQGVIWKNRSFMGGQG